MRIDVRQGSLLLSFFADGRIGPTALCVERTPKPLGKLDPLLKKEVELVDPRVPKMPAARCEFDELRARFPNILLYAQSKAYFDTRTFAAFWDDFLNKLPRVPHIVVMDNAEPHFSSHVKRASMQRNVQLVSTPPNCTDLCAATDAGLGKSVKLLMKNKFRLHFRSNIEQWRCGKVSLRERRFLVMKWLSESVKEFSVVGKKQIMQAHVRCGTGLRFDGSENHLVQIDGYDGAISF